jgi:hypothetical protein
MTALPRYFSSEKFSAKYTSNTRLRRCVEWFQEQIQEMLGLDVELACQFSKKFDGRMASFDAILPSSMKRACCGTLQPLIESTGGTSAYFLRACSNKARKRILT